MSETMKVSAAAAESFLDATRTHTYMFDAARMPLRLAVIYRAVFLTELWRAAVLPWSCEKEMWQNVGANANNETIELQLQQLPVRALTADAQHALIRTYTAGLATAPEAFVQAWARDIDAATRDMHVALHERNEHPQQKRLVTAEHLGVQPPNPADSPLPSSVSTPSSLSAAGSSGTAGCGGAPPTVGGGYVMPFEDGRVRHASLFYLEPTVSRVSEVSRVALRARLVLVRARDNACFNVFCHVGFFGAEMFRDVSPTSQATLDAVRAVFAQKQLLREDGSVDAARMRFEMQQTGAIYTSAFCWFAATNILLVRLAQLRGRVRFVPTTEIVTEGGGVTFEWVLREGELSAPWESEMLAARTDTFLRTGGLPLALEKREVAQGYIELEVARFVATQLLETQYGVSLARVSCFERFDQDQMIVRVQSLDPRATAEDVARLFVRAADQCAEMTRAFYKTYASTF